MKKAFTLLEMFIVLGIIALILSVLTVSFTTTQKKSRDAKRKGDLKAIQNGLEQYYSICGYGYPVGNSLGSSLICVAASKTLIPAIPKDPKDNSNYAYTSADGTSFTLCTSVSQGLEAETPTSYCVDSQQ